MQEWLKHMRKITAVAALLSLCGAAQAHVLPVPFEKINGLDDIVHQAALGTVGGRQPAPSMPQITCDLATGVASVGGPCTVPTGLQPVCQDNSAVITRNVTMVTSTAGSPPANRNLQVSVNTFTSGDVGKYITVPGAAGGAGELRATITAFVDAQNVTLSVGALTAKAGVATTMVYGADDAPYFKQFNVWARANQGTTNQVVLNIPTGGACWFGSLQSITGGGNLSYWYGINNVITEGNSTTFSSENGGQGFSFTSGEQCHKGLNFGGCSARIKSVSAGALTVELTATSYAAGHISRFSATPGAQGSWIMVGGIDTQSLWGTFYGYPSNPTYFEWRQVTSICNNTGPCVGTATITLDRPLSYTLLDTWPEYNSGNAGEADPGGPATIWGYPAEWNSTAEFRNIALKQVNQTNSARRYVIMRGITTTSATGAGAIPSQSEEWSAYNSSFVHMEADKIVQNFLLDGVTMNILKCQSNSITNTIIRNSAFTGSPGSQFTGCGRYTEVYDSTIKALYVGPQAYGAGTSFKCVRCDVESFKYNESGIPHDPQSDFTMSGGVITFPNTAASTSDNAQRIFSPLPSNLLMMVGGSFSGPIGVIHVTGISQDATNTYVQTDQAGGFPPWSGGLTRLQTVPVAEFTSDASTGDPMLVAQNIQNGCPAAAAMNSCGVRTYTPSATGNIGQIPATGKIVSLEINVTVAGVTASGNLTMNPTAQFNQATVKQSDWTAYNWLPTINLKTGGKRTYTNSGSGTGSWECDRTAFGGSITAGGCSGDTVTGAGLPPEQVWVKSVIDPHVTAGGTVTVTPTVRIAVKTDQGLLP